MPVTSLWLPPWIRPIGLWAFPACAQLCGNRGAHTFRYLQGLCAASARSLGRLCFDSCRPSLRHPSLASRDPAKKLGSALGIYRCLPLLCLSPRLRGLHQIGKPLSCLIADASADRSGQDRSFESGPYFRAEFLPSFRASVEL